VFTQEEVDVAANLPVQLELRCSYEGAVYSFLAVVAWTAQEGVTTFVGLAFVEPVEEGPFFDRYFLPYL